MEDDDFELVQLGLISFGRNRYDVYELYRRTDDDGNDFVYGKYELNKKSFIAGRSHTEENLSYNLSCIARMRQKGLHRCRAAQVKLLKYRLYLN